MSEEKLGTGKFVDMTLEELFIQAEKVTSRFEVLKHLGYRGELIMHASLNNKSLMFKIKTLNDDQTMTDFIGKSLASSSMEFVAYNVDIWLAHLSLVDAKIVVLAGKRICEMKNKVVGNVHGIKQIVDSCVQNGFSDVDSIQHAEVYLKGHVFEEMLDGLVKQ